MDIASTLNALRRRYPWPRKRPNVRPIDWGLDVGGKQLVIEQIIRSHRSIVLEIGVFLGGSAKMWLDLSPDVVVIAVDPWAGSLSIGAFARRHGQPDWACHQLESYEDAIYDTFLVNMWQYQDRIIPVRGLAPAALYDLASHALKPDLVYLDADKSGGELEVCHELFPQAILTGDDWFCGTDRFWSPNEGYPIRKPVLDFCQLHHRYLLVDKHTWVITEERPTLRRRFTLEPGYQFKSLRRRLRGATRYMLGLDKRAPTAA